MAKQTIDRKKPLQKWPTGLLTFNGEILVINRSSRKAAEKAANKKK